MTIKQIHIYDLDGTLCDSEHRFRMLPNGKIDLEYWRANSTPEKIKRDKPKELAELYKKQLQSGEHYIAIATARIACPATLAWIQKHLGMPHKLIARQGEKDTRKGASMKIQGLRYLKTFKQFARLPKWIYEDNPEYLYPIADYFNANPVLIQSNQGI